MRAAAAEELAQAWNEGMMRGEFEQAWRASDAIRALGVDDPHRFWNGEDFAGKRVMLRCLHGFGDAVQFLRYVPSLRSSAASVCVEVAPRLVEWTSMVPLCSSAIFFTMARPSPVPPFLPLVTND